MNRPTASDIFTASEDFAIRFDIVSIVIRAGREPEVRHILGAFT